MIPDLEESQPHVDAAHWRQVCERVRESGVVLIETQAWTRETAIGLGLPVLSVWITLPVGGLMMECYGN